RGMRNHCRNRDAACTIVRRPKQNSGIFSATRGVAIYRLASASRAIGIFGPIDCSQELSSRSLKLAYTRFPHFVEAVPPIFYDRYSFSRVSFWKGGNTVDLAVTLWCGNLCGSGTETVWRRQNGRWVQVQEKLVWLS